MDRRSFLKRIAAVLGGLLAVLRRPVGAEEAPAAQRWAVRPVAAGDEDGLVAVMRACVSSGESFHGLCNEMEWTRTWAEAVVRDRPRSLVIAVEESILAYCDVPTRTPRTFGEATVDHYQRSFWCGTAGVRMDVLQKDLAVRVFRHLLYRVFAQARELGYEYVRAAAPWEKHPHFSKPFAEYPGLTVQSFLDEQGATKFLLEWRLKDAMDALASEGANGELGS